MKNRLWKNWFLLLLGLWITILPWTGFPQQIKTPLTVVTGLAVIALAFVLARPAADDVSRPSQEKLFSDENFIEDNEQ